MNMKKRKIKDYQGGIMFSGPEPDVDSGERKSLVRKVLAQLIQARGLLSYPWDQRKYLDIGILLLGILFLGACSAPASNQQAFENEQPMAITVYKDPSCGCCSRWSEYMEENGYTVIVEEVQNLGEIKDNYNIPVSLRSCHTAIINGYVIEGHVPVVEIDRLMAERPQIIGLAVPGMPPGSPGMETDDSVTGTFDVVTFDENGNSEVFASYP